MKKVNSFLLILSIGVVIFCVYSWHGWYWTVTSWIHPDVTRKYEEQFKTLSNKELVVILGERVSPRTGGAAWVLQERKNTDDIFDELFDKKLFSYITSDKEKKVYNYLRLEYLDDSFTWQHARSMQILAKLGYEEMIPEAEKFAARGQYDEALEALQYFIHNKTARKVIEQIATQDTDAFAADRAKKML